MKKVYISLLLPMLIAFFAFAVYMTKQSQQFGATIPTTVALFETSLANKITSTATSATLVSGTTKSSTTLSGTYGFIIDEGSSNEEFVICSVSNTALTSCTRGVDVIDGKTTVTALEHEHRRGASIKITNFPQLAILSRINNGQESFPNLVYYKQAMNFVTASTSVLVDKNYVDSGVLAGCAASTQTVKGCVEMATLAEINAGTAIGGTTAFLAVGPASLAASIYGLQLPSSGQKSALAGSSGTPGAANLYITQNDVSSSSFSDSADKVIRSDGDSSPTALWLVANKISTGATSASGDMLVRSTTGYARLASAGADNYILVSSSSFSTEMTWRPKYDFISLASASSGNITTPSSANRAEVRAKALSGGYDIVCEFTVYRTNKPTGQCEHPGLNGVNTNYIINAVWSGNTISLTEAGDGTALSAISDNSGAWFFR